MQPGKKSAEICWRTRAPQLEFWNPVKFRVCEVRILLKLFPQLIAIFRFLPILLFESPSRSPSHTLALVDFAGVYLQIEPARTRVFCSWNGTWRNCPVCIREKHSASAACKPRWLSESRNKVKIVECASRRPSRNFHFPSASYGQTKPYPRLQAFLHENRYPRGVMYFIFASKCNSVITYPKVRLPRLFHSIPSFMFLSLSAQYSIHPRHSSFHI